MNPRQYAAASTVRTCHQPTASSVLQVHLLERRAASLCESLPLAGLNYPQLLHHPISPWALHLQIPTAQPNATPMT